jgi:hypothetical protein
MMQARGGGDDSRVHNASGVLPFDFSGVRGSAGQKGST